MLERMRNLQAAHDSLVEVETVHSILDGAVTLEHGDGDGDWTALRNRALHAALGSSDVAELIHARARGLLRGQMRSQVGEARRQVADMELVLEEVKE